MLGNSDEINEFENLTQNIFSGFGGGILNKMLGNAMKMLEKEMQKEMKMQKKYPDSHMQLFINGKRIDVPQLQNQVQNKKQIQKKEQKIKSIHFNETNQKKFTELGQKEPATNLKRLGDTILYEITLPQVKSLKDISIIKLENSIEIKAISKDTSYFKSISINLPLINYEFSEEKLILEFESKN